MFFWGFVSEYKKEHLTYAFKWYISMARGAGYTLNLNTALVILLSARLLFTRLRDTPLSYILPLDKAFPAIHMLVGYVIAAGVAVHGTFHVIWIVKYDQWGTGLWQITMSAVTGFVLLFIFSLMLFFARPKVRKDNFRLFYFVHIVGATLFFALLVFHGMYDQDPETYKYIVPPLIIYLIDRVLRRVKVVSADLELSAEHSVFKSNQVLELRVPKPFKYKAGQYAEIKVPSINNEWHPFTIASASHETTMSFYIKALGDWTDALHAAFQSRLDGDVLETLAVRVRGPYGAPCQDVKGYERVVLISGGIGATPFSAVCKDLHHLNTTLNKPIVSDFKKGHGLKAIEPRVHQAISALYDVDIENLSNESVEVERRSQYVADMIRMTSATLNGRDPHPAETSDSDADFDFDAVHVEEDELSSERMNSRRNSFLTVESAEGGVGQERSFSPTQASTTAFVSGKGESFFSAQTSVDGKHGQARLRKLYNHRGRLLAFLHTTRLNFLLLLSLIARIVVLCMASIFSADYVRLHNPPDTLSSGQWVVIADTSLNSLLAVILPLTIFLEISFMGVRFFKTFGRCVDFFAFLPLTIVCTAIGVKTWITSEPESVVVLVFHYVVFIPVMFILLSFRMYRSIGSRSLLVNEPCKCELHGKIPDVDFVWTTPTSTDDAWLRGELEPLATGTEVKLHRYVTRAKSDADIEGGTEGFITTTKTGRPQWDELFQGIAEKAPSDSEIGVFFCGPHTMGKAIQKSLRKVEIVSNLKGAYLRGTSAKILMSDLRISSKRTVKQLRSVGCSVRFVFREENFG